MFENFPDFDSKESNPQSQLVYMYFNEHLTLYLIWHFLGSSNAPTNKDMVS